MKIEQDEPLFTPVNIKLETIQEYIFLHDLMGYLQDSPSTMYKVLEYIKGADNDARPKIYMIDIDMIARNLMKSLYNVKYGVLK